MRSRIPAVMRTPRKLDIDITGRCNLRCRYCYFYDNPAVVYRDLPAKEWLDFFDELGSLGVMNVALAGGEPFIREDLPVLLDGIVRNRMRFSLLSNGSLIDDSIAAFITHTNRCEYVQISVDGSCAAVHDSCRGQGAFDGAVSGIYTLLRHKVNVMVRVTIHRNNVDDLENIARFLLEELRLPKFGTNSAGYFGTCRENADDILLTVAERQSAMKTLLRLEEKYPGRITASAGPLAEGHEWYRMEDARAKDEPTFPNRGYLTACGCPASKIAVRADGVIIPCSMLPHIELGRINQDSLMEIWLHSPALNQLRNRQSIPLPDSV
jgi:SynChlorMet cassette radical SAM/SPASM protein ScmE